MLNEQNVLLEKSKVKYGNAYGYLGSLGFIVMATDTVMQENLRTLAPKGVAISVAPIASPNEITVEGLHKHIDTMAHAASLIQPDAPTDLVCYACTSGSIVIGEQKVAQQIRLGAPKSKPMTLVTGVIDALRSLNTKSIVVATPYIDEVNNLEYQFLINKGFNVLDIKGMQIDDGSIMGNITPNYIKEFAISLDRPDADAIFISCGGIRTIDILQEIEDEVKKPVISSNQAMMWSCLRRINVSANLKGFGKLFEISDILNPSPI